jgi:3-hydroxybutyryl-CoA dehydrogenase
MKPKRAKSQKQKKTAPKHEDGRAIVYIIGDPENVVEYTSLCAAHGYKVAFDWNETPDPVPAYGSASIKRQTNVPANASFALELTNVDLDRKRRNLAMLDEALPATTAITSSSLTVSATEQSSWIKHRVRLVGCSALPTLNDKPLIEIAPTVFSPPETVLSVQRFFRSLGKEIELVQDRIGLVFPRILCQMVNESAFALQDEIASPHDIDLAMKLGASYPLGPIEWADRIGMRQVCSVLTALQRDLGEDRARVAPLLKQLAAGGTWWHHTKSTVEERQSP